MKVEEVHEMKPHLRLESEDLPVIKKWEVGKTYTLLLTVKQVAKHEREDCCSGEFEVLKAKDATQRKEFDKRSVMSALEMKKNY